MERGWWRWVGGVSLGGEGDGVSMGSMNLSVELASYDKISPFLTSDVKHLCSSCVQVSKTNQVDMC